MKEKIIKYNKYIIGAIILILIGVISVNMYQKVSTKILKENLKDINWVRNKVSIIKDDTLGKNIYKVEKNKNISIFSDNYIKVIDEKLEDIQNNDYTIDNPLLILNPYGTNNLGLNIYFNTSESLEISYTISVDNEDIPDFSRTLNNDDKDNYTKEHIYQIIGLVPGEVNTIKLIAKNKDKDKITNSFTIDMTNIECESDTILESTKGKSKEDLEDGLFVIFGLDKAFNANNYIYDNNGVLRADLVLHEYRSDRIIFHKDNLYYSYDTNKIAEISKLGKIEKKYTLDDYIMHHDYVLDEKNNKLLILVNSKKDEDKTIEDLIISLDLKTGEVKEVVDMKDLMSDFYETAKMPESGKNTYGGTGLDWIHLNSLSLVNSNGDIVVSAREISTIIYIKDIYQKPTLKYLIADKEVYKDTKYEDLVLDQIGDFVNQAGQHTVTYVEDEDLKKGQYYLEMYNNNYASSVTRENFPWDEYEGAGTFEEGESSKYYKYLVDENKGTYKLVEEFDVAYSSIVSSVQDLDDNHVTSSGKSNCYAEYDEEGNLIKRFNYTSKKYAYRVFKYDFEDVWFD